MTADLLVTIPAGHNYRTMTPEIYLSSVAWREVKIAIWPLAMFSEFIYINSSAIDTSSLHREKSTDMKR